MELGALLLPIFDLLTRSGAELVPVHRDSDTAPAAIASLRAETATVRRDHGEEDVSGVSLWSIAERVK